MGSIAVLIDGGYMMNVLKRYGEPRIDYGLFVQWVCGADSLFRAYYYTCPPHQSSSDEDREKASRAESFFNALERLNHFIVRLGRLEYRGTKDDGSPIYIQKMVDILIGIDMATLILHRRVDKIAVI
jgi:uncharacterized LabA/DUF88 family protein